MSAVKGPVKRLRWTVPHIEGRRGLELTLRVQGPKN